MKKKIKVSLFIAWIILSYFGGFCFGRIAIVSCYFSSQKETKPNLILLLNNSKETVDIAIYGITEKDIVQAITNLQKRGVKVRVVADKIQSCGNSSKTGIIKDAKIPIKIMTGWSGGIMHHKFIVVDGKTVLTGSYNFTDGATTKNYENYVIIKNKKVANEYEREFTRLWGVK